MVLEIENRGYFLMFSESFTEEDLKVPDSLLMCRPQPIAAKKDPITKCWLVLQPTRNGYRFVWKKRASFQSVNYSSKVRTFFYSTQDYEDVKYELLTIFQENFEAGSPIKKYKTPRPRDNQRSKAYKWETEIFIKDKKVSKEELVSFLKKVCETIGFKMPRVKFWGTYCGAKANEVEMTFSAVTCKKSYALHELAHSISFYQDRVLTKSGLEREGHGPEWLGIYINLIDMFLDGYKKADLLKSALEAKLRVKDSGIVI